MNFDPGSRSKLTRRDLPRFGDDTLFHRIARCVCEAECLPRKELFEAWEVARRARRRFRGGRVLDLACGHALLAQLLLLLDDSSPSAVAVDVRIPSSAHRLSERLAREWPRLRGRVQLVEGEIASVAPQAGDLLVSCHACGALTDDVLSLAINAQARVVVLPCCQDKLAQDQGGLGGWLDPALAIDVTRAARLREHGYAVHTQIIAAAITPKNRLLLADPKKPAAAH
ncbi:MAG TPA: methyltransferase [Polyangiaceae bacterium]|jgi:SAM-dependent methyltransferase|nr:methyltransferase [Polyangiaceae bacterium]